jgi:hypothetical protein
MRSLAQPAVLARAGLAAAATTLACYPRLADWKERPWPLPFGLSMMVVTTFVLWAFVFAWHEQYSGKPVFPVTMNPKLWGMATLYGIVAAILLTYCFDPEYRVSSPTSYPTNVSAWIGTTLFALALDPLFRTFATYAFFVRLARRQHVATALTVIFGAFVSFLKLHGAHKQPPGWVMAEVMAGTVAGGFLSIYFYLEGGAWLVWWLLLLTQMRHLVSLI